MSAFDTFVKKFAEGGRKKATDWDRRDGEMRACELIKLAADKGVRISKHALYEGLNADVIAGTVTKRRGGDGKVYYKECLPAQTTRKPRSGPRSR